MRALGRNHGHGICSDNHAGDPTPRRGNRYWLFQRTLPAEEETRTAVIVSLCGKGIRASANSEYLRVFVRTGKVRC